MFGPFLSSKIVVMIVQNKFTPSEEVNCIEAVLLIVFLGRVMGCFCAKKCNKNISSLGTGQGQS